MSSTPVDSTPALLVITPSNEVRWANQEVANLFNVALDDLLSAPDVLDEIQTKADRPVPSLADLVERVRQTGRVRKHVSLKEDSPDSVHGEWIVEGSVTSGPDGEELVQLLFRTGFASTGPASLSGRHLDVTLASIADAVVVTDTEGRVTRMNKVAEELTEWTAANARGRSIASVLELRNAETREPVENPVEEVLENDETVGLANDTVLVGKDGTERQIADSAAPIRTDEGDVLGVVMVFRDVTEDYERRRALRASEERWRRLVEQSPEAIYVTVNGELRYLNEAAVEVLGGNSAEALLGRSIIDFAPPGAEGEFEVRRRKLENRTATEPIERRMVRLDGEERIVVVQSVSIRYEGEPAVQTIIRDVTERRRLERKLHQAQRMETVGTLAGGIAHDFNNILHSAQAYLEIASQDLPVNHQVRPFLSRTEKGLHRAEELVKKLLTFSRQKSTKTRERVDLAVLARDTLDLAEPSLPGTLEIRMHLEDGCVVVGDPSQLKQVLMNLVTNAGQAMEGLDGDNVLEVVVQSVEMDADLAARHPTLDPGRYVCLTVSDTGSGMDDETKEHIFEPFFTTKGLDKGTGLGLSVVHGIVQSHGGDITVRSQQGKGTTFDAYLPSASDADDEGTVEEAVETPNGVSSRGHVLVIDDEEQVLEMETIRLQRFGYEVTPFRHGRKALEAVESAPNEYDLVLTDYAMPDMSGLDLTRTLRKRGYDLPVILMSGYSAQVSDAEVNEAGVTAFLRKPVGTNELRAVMDELV